MHDIYRQSRTPGRVYRDEPGLWLTRPRPDGSWMGVLAWLGRLALIVLFGAGVTRIVLELTGA